MTQSCSAQPNETLLAKKFLVRMLSLKSLIKQSTKANRLLGQQVTEKTLFMNALMVYFLLTVLVPDS